MSQGDILGVGILLVALGAVFWLATRLLLRSVPRIQPQAQAQPVQAQIGERQAVILIQPGGRVLQINAPGRELFRLLEKESPNLEQLTRRIRPAEKFLELCAQEGRAALVIDGQTIEAVSYPVKFPSEMVMVVSISKPGPEVAAGDAQPYTTPQSFIWLSEFTQEVGTSLDLELTLRALQESLDRMLPADFVEVSLWQSEEEHLVPYRFVGPTNSERKLEDHR